MGRPPLVKRLKERGEKAVRIGRLAKEELLPPGQIGRRLHAPVGPSHLRDAVFVEQGAPLVVPAPSGRPMSQGFGE